nr:hypothetical protein Iba_chr11cCG0270 [Ipomoea batatas]GMD57992.1 hypothetical protein Iba_chr11fCG1290 [Ipomoea batatas]
MQLSSISPAPNSSTALASSYAPIGRPSRPPFTLKWYQAYSSPFGPGFLTFLGIQGSRTAYLHSSQGETSPSNRCYKIIAIIAG